VIFDGGFAASGAKNFFDFLIKIFSINFDVKELILRFIDWKID